MKSWKNETAPSSIVLIIMVTYWVRIIIDFKPLTPRICILRMRGKFFINYSIVNGHASTETSDNEEKDGFFDALERTYDISPRNYTKIVIGDFNAQVGKEAVNFHMTGKYSLHSLTNDNGSWLIQFAVLWNMIIQSKFYPYKDLQKCTWRSLDGVTFSQIDHLLIERRHKSNLRDVSSYQGASTDSNHCLVIACLRA